MKEVTLMKPLTFSLAALLVLASCAGQPKTAPASGRHYFSGDGGKGKSLAVLVPEGQGLSAEENYLPSMVQGSLVSDFTKFSAISILDRQNLDKMLGETENAIYTETEDIVRFGKVAQTQYVLTGKLLKTQSGYNITMSVLDTKTAETAASYSGSCTAAELENLQGVKRVSEELLAKLGVTLTAEGRNELAGINQQAVNAERSLARGITAQKEGTIVEALAYMYQANFADPGLKEAASRLNSLSASVTSGNIREDFKNDMELREAWIKTLAEAEEYFSKFFPVRLAYDPFNPQQGNLDYPGLVL
jgi:TolB-like protein